MPSVYRRNLFQTISAAELEKRVLSQPVSLRQVMVTSSVAQWLVRFGVCFMSESCISEEKVAKSPQPALTIVWGV